MRINIPFRFLRKVITLVILSVLLTVSFNSVMAQGTDQNKKSFETLLKTAEQHYRAKEYKDAKTAYKQILEIQPENRFAKDRLKAIAKVYVDPEEEEAFKDAMEKGEAFLTQQNFDKATEFFEKAKSIKPGDRDVRGKIEQVALIRSQVEELDKNYNAAIEKAGDLLAADDLNNAKTYYEQAVLLKPLESMPKNKIDEIDKILADRKERDQNYKTAIDMADNLYIERKFTQAKAAYAEAQKINPSEAYPQSMIDKILPMLADMASKQEQYDNLIKSGDGAFNNKDFDSAITFYTQANELMPEQDYPGKQLSLIESLQADAAALQQKYGEAIDLADALLVEQKYDCLLYTSIIQINREPTW